MKRSWKVAAAGVALTTAMATSGAFAGVANTSQKGSLLMYARIDVSPGFDTIVRLSNDNNAGVDVKCYYMNEVKGRRDFEFKLTKKQPVWWSVYNGYGSISVNKFPNDSADARIPGSVDRGELICWAVDRTGYNQISFNHLSGTATIYDFDDAGGPSAFQYNSWNFKAGASVAPGATVGVAGSGDILLNGTDYDYCPGYLIGHFSPADSYLYSRDGNYVFVADNDLSVISCNQDLRQDYNAHFTKLELTVWNEYEVKYTGAWECSNGYHFFDLYTADKAPEIFTYDVLHTNAAMVMVEGVKSTRCYSSISPFPQLVTEDAGLVGVLSTSTYVNGDTEARENEIGTTLNAAGFKPGRVQWDPQPLIVPEKR